MGKKKKLWLIPLIASGVVIIAIAAIPLSIMFQIKSNQKELKKSFSLREINQIKEESFYPLNEVKHPSTELKTITLDANYKNSILDFTHLFTSTMDDFSYSPLNLYFAYDTLSWGSDDVALSNRWNSVLGLTREERNKGLKQLYPSDFYLNENGSLQLYQGLFAKKGKTVNNSLLTTLTERYCEAYSVDFSSDEGIKMMLNWIDEKLDEKGFLSKKDLDIKQETAAYLCNTLYFRSKWSTKYNKANTKKESFYSTDGEQKSIPFMKHKIYTDIYEYEGYYSFYDYYKNGEKIQYLISKDDNVNIDKVLKGNNFYKETKDKKTGIVDLSMPKFTDESMTDFIPSLKKVGLEDVLDDTKPSLNNFFSNLYEGENIYLMTSKQKNKVTFDEDGTIVKSLGMQTYGDAKTEPMDYYRFTLNHPFIYTIYDRNGLPIYTSKVNKI